MLGGYQYQLNAPWLLAPPGTPPLIPVVWFDAQAISGTNGVGLSVIPFEAGTDATTVAGKSDGVYRATGINGYPSIEASFSKQFQWPFDLTGSAYMLATVFSMTGNRNFPSIARYQETGGDTTTDQGGFDDTIRNALNFGFGTNNGSGGSSVPTQIGTISPVTGVTSWLAISRLMLDGTLNTTGLSLDGGGEFAHADLLQDFNTHKFLGPGIATARASQLNTPELIIQIGEIFVVNREVSDVERDAFMATMLAKWDA